MCDAIACLHLMQKQAKNKGARRKGRIPVHPVQRRMSLWVE